MEYREFTEDEQKWIKSFKKVMKKAPSTLFMFVGAGVTVFADRVMKDSTGGEVVDQYNTNEPIQTDMECDGGDY